MIYLTAPIFIIEIQQFSQLFPQYFEKMAPTLKNLGVAAFESFDSFIKVSQDWLVKASASIFGAIAAIFGGIFSTLTIFTLALFISLEEGGIEKTIGLFAPKARETYVLSIWKSCQNKVAGWFGAKVITCLFIGVFSFLALYLFKVNYPLALALIAGITNIVPIIGPVIAGIVIFMFAAIDSWFKAFFVLIVFILLHQIEGNIITPILTKKFIGLPPVLVLISLLIGGQLLGITGAILTIPFAGVIYELLKDYLKKKKEPKTESL
jgi:predicted PurR-regulated permease PerM